MGKDLKGKKLPTGICQRKDGLYSVRFTSKTGRRVEKFFKKPNEAKKWLEDANIGITMNLYVHNTDEEKEKEIKKFEEAFQLSLV